MALLSDVHGVRLYFVGDRPRSGRYGGDNAEGAGAGGSQEEPLDELSELRYVGQDAGWLGKLLHERSGKLIPTFLAQCRL